METRRARRRGGEDPLDCGAPPRCCPAVVAPCNGWLLLERKFPPRKKPEVTATLLMHNPLFAGRENREETKPWRVRGGATVGFGLDGQGVAVFIDVAGNFA